jgi:hypothetical protein
MKRRTLLGLLCLFVSLAGLVWVGPATHAVGSAQRMQVNATVIGIGGRLAGRSRPFTLIVNSYTPAGDVERLNDALRTGGQDELLRSISDLDAGRISIGNNVGVRANVIIRTPRPEGGERLTVIYERNVNFYELRYGTRSQDYRFGYAEIFLDRNGRGEGTFIPAARVRLRDGNTWEVEDFGVYPARLMGVRATGRVPAR